MKSSETIAKLAQALNTAQSQLGSVFKGSVNPYYDSNYADINDVIRTVKETLNKNGITFIQPLFVKEVAGVKITVVETVLLHNSGEFISSETEVVTKTEGDPQKYGASITYSRRYGLQSILGLPAEDDDGNLAAGKKVTEKATPAKTDKTKFVNRGKPIQNTSIQGGTDDI